MAHDSHDVRGFVKLKKCQKSKKNSEVGGCFKFFSDFWIFF